MSNQGPTSNDLDDDFSPTFSSLVKNLQDVHVPWSKQFIPIGTGLILCDKSDPQMARERSAFSESSILGNLVFNEESRLMYKEVDSDMSSSHSEHKSVSASVSVGGSLLGASVEGGFNKALKSAGEVQKTSVHGACRLGVITFKEEPQLRAKARNRVHPRLLRFPDAGEFAGMYGDYYVAGLILGANSSVLAIIDQAESQVEENWHIKVTVKILLTKLSGQHDSHSSDHQAYGKVSLIGFDSLTGSTVGVDSAAGRAVGSSDRNMLEKFVGLGKSLEERARREMQQLGLLDGMTVDQALCEKAFESGLVVDLLLRPMSKLSTYIEATYER